MVSRKTRVSTECAPSMLLDDLMMLIDEEEDIDQTEVLKYDTGSLTGSGMVSRMLQRKCAPYQCCMMI